MRRIKLAITPYTNPKQGTLSFRVTGYIRDEKIAEKMEAKTDDNGRVRKNFKSEEKARAWIQKAELLAGRSRPKHTVRTWIKQDDVEWLEAAINELGDAKQVLYAAEKYRKERDSLVSPKMLAEQMDEYLATKRNQDGPHVKRTRNRLNQAIQKKGLSGTSDLLGEKLVQWLSRGNVGGTNLRNDWIAWHGFCEWLVAHGRLPRNPVKLIARPRKDTPPPRSLSNDEWAALIKHAKKSKHARYLVPYYFVCTMAGLRPQSEWPHIGWGSIVLDVAPEYRCIKVIRQKNQGSERYVKIQPALEAEIHAWKKAKWPIGGFELWGNTQLERKIRAAHDAVLDAAGVEWQADILRHTFASNAVHYFTKSELKDQMGTQESTIARYYIHPKPPEKMAAFWGESGKSNLVKAEKQSQYRQL